jgi:hypothetical protein
MIRPLSVMTGSLPFVAVRDSIGLSDSSSSYWPIGTNETGKITRGKDKKMMAEGLLGCPIAKLQEEQILKMPKCT